MADIITPGIADEEFIRGDVPMTKMEVRAVSLAKLKLTRDAVVYDIGAGTGSVSVECANLSDSVKVYAIEKNEDALDLIKKNADRFGLPNIEIIPGEAPDILEALPAPTHVFIGGSSGNMNEIIHSCIEKNPEARFVVNLIMPESLAKLLDCLKLEDVTDPEIVQITVARSKKVGSGHLMQGLNPVWIVSFSGIL